MFSSWKRFLWRMAHCGHRRDRRPRRPGMVGELDYLASFAAGHSGVLRSPSGVGFIAISDQPGNEGTPREPVPRNRGSIRAPSAGCPPSWRPRPTRTPPPGGRLGNSLPNNWRRQTSLCSPRRSIGTAVATWSHSLRPFSLARQSFNHPRTGRLLAAVCAITEPGTRDAPEPSPLYTEAADLIADRFADSPDIGHFCEGLGFLSNGSQRSGAALRAAFASNSQGQS